MVLDYAQVIFIALVLSMLLRTFVAQAYRIPSGSMKPTLLVGDYVFVEKVTYWFRPPARGDVVVFKYPHQDNDVNVSKWIKEKYELVVFRRRVPRHDYVKRIIGVGGDVVAGKSGIVFVNGRPVRERYVRAGARDDFGPYKVPVGAYFVMGDNRGDSRDSRHWGFVQRRLIRGRVRGIYWSWAPGYCPRHRSTLTRLYRVRLTDAPGKGGGPVEYLCDAGGERLIDREDVAVAPWYEFWRHLRSERIFLAVE